MKRRPNPEWSESSVKSLTISVRVVKQAYSVYRKCKLTSVGSQRFAQTFLLHITQYS